MDGECWPSKLTSSERQISDGQCVPTSQINIIEMINVWWTASADHPIELIEMVNVWWTVSADHPNWHHRKGVKPNCKNVFESMIVYRWENGGVPRWPPVKSVGKRSRSKTCCKAKRKSTLYWEDHPRRKSWSTSLKETSCKAMNNL